MCSVRRASAILVICLTQILQSSAAPEVSVGSSRTSAIKSQIPKWGQFLSGSSNSEPSFDALFRSAEKRSRNYNFGLGKKSVLSDELEMDEMNGLEDALSNNNWMKRITASPKMVRTGRVRNSYSFGLGKRGWFPSITYPASAPYLGDIKRRYSFGLGKRSLPGQEENTSAAGYDDPSLRGNK